MSTKNNRRTNRHAPKQLTLDEFLSSEYRQKTRINYTIVKYMIGSSADIARALKWVIAQDKLNALYDNRPSADEQLAMFAEMGLQFVDAGEPVAEYPAADEGTASTDETICCARTEDLLSKYNSAFMYGIGGTFANSPGRRVREAEDAWIAEHAAGRDRYEAREAARAAVAMAA